jgi:hypothetical protein
MKYHYKDDIRDQHDELYKTKYKNYKSKTKSFFSIPEGYPRHEKFSKSGFSVLTQQSFSDNTLISIQMLSDPSFVKRVKLPILLALITQRNMCHLFRKKNTLRNCPKHSPSCLQIAGDRYYIFC